MTWRRWTWCAGAALPVLVIACSIGGREEVPVHGWWSERGPVVPHDSFPADCALCHLSGSWSDLLEDFQFDHAAETGVPLAGAHARAECLRCHNDRGPAGMFAARGCAGCHEDVHLAQLGQNCEDCHVERDWRPTGVIAQHNRTRFPLVGAHAATACWRCHPGADVGRFVGTDPDCANCHGADLARAVSPNHSLQGWVTDCDRCHIPTTWTGAGFNHAFFPLTGAHRTLECSACHTGEVFGGLPTDCFGCHEGDYLAAGDPDHAALGVPTDCALCHGTFTWQGATFDHGWIQQACVDCHLADYLGANDPDHVGQGFPQDCEACHSTTSWYGGSFDHDFPIDSGKHKNLSCVDCHLAPGDFGVFTCTMCHEHLQPDMDDEHDRVNGYVYETSACYACHPDGTE